MRVVLLGGPFDGVRVDISRTPPRIDVGRVRYLRIDDPDTGECLGGYAASQVHSLRATLSPRTRTVRTRVGRQDRKDH